MIMIGIWSAFSADQEAELIIVPKNKKKYVSEQQYVELDGNLIIVTHENIEAAPTLSASLSRWQQLIAAVQKRCLTNVNDYIDGEKDCFLKQANKMQRTDCYEKLVKCKHKIETGTQKLKKMQQQIEFMCKDLQQQLQDLLDAECFKNSI